MNRIEEIAVNKGETEKMPEGKGGVPTKRLLTRGKKRMIFYVLMMAIPVLQFLFFYVYINMNSIIMAFKSYDDVTKSFYWVGFEHFKEAWDIILESGSMIKYSLILYAINLVIVMGLALIFSYYIAKKFMCSGFFRVVLYLPQIVSSVIFVMLYKTLVTDISYALFGVILLEKYEFLMILIFNVWLGFGTNVMLFTGSMSAISPSVIESSHIDGVNIWQEFLYITIPSIWGTFVTFVVVGLANLFLNQMHLYTFNGDLGSEYATFGYYFYVMTRRNTLASFQTSDAYSVSMQTLSAMGVMITIVLVPTTLGVKWLLEKFGPSTE